MLSVAIFVGSTHGGHLRLYEGKVDYATTYAYDNDDALTATSGGFINSYTYNANGDQTTRTLSGTTSTLVYDYDDQLTSTGGSGFAYDTAGRRVSRTAGGVTTSFLYDGGSVLLEKQGSTTSATYTYGNSLIRKDGETPLFDGLGSERTVTNASQAVTASLTLSAFGQTVASSGSSTSAYQFGATSGYRTEGDVGLTLVGCRFYDAQVGRFITRDTYLDQAPYAYCDGDPVNAMDPSGHAPCRCGRKGGRKGGGKGGGNGGGGVTVVYNGPVIYNGPVNYGGPVVYNGPVTNNPTSGGGGKSGGGESDGGIGKDIGKGIGEGAGTKIGEKIIELTIKYGPKLIPFL